MKFKLIASLAVLLSAAVVNAQTCLSSFNLSNICGASSAKMASGVCISGVSQSVGSSSGSCSDASAIVQQLNSLCSSTNNCTAPPPPPVTVNVSIRSMYGSKTLNGANYDIFMSHNTLDPLECMNITSRYNFSLSSSDSRNSSFLAVVPAGQWLNVNMTCPSGPVVSQPDMFTRVYQYPAGCYVTSYSSASAPPPLQCY